MASHVRPEEFVAFTRARQMVNPIVHMKHAGMHGTVQCEGNAFVSTGT
jgi:hypothetical protein